LAPASRDGPDVSGLWQIFSAKLVHEEGGVSAFYGSDVAKLRSYQAAGVDQFCYGANFGLEPAMALRSLELFITEVMPHFVE
jgi:hypothetical protein